MTIQIDFQSFIVLLVIFSLLIIIASTSTIISIVSCHRYRRQLDDTNRLLYFNLKSNDRLKETLSEHHEEIQMIETNVEQIANDLRIKIQQDAMKASKKVYPKPDVANLITETIQDQIQIELSLSKNLRAPSGDYIEVITDAVIRTYPEIDPNYITKKCVALIDNFTVQNRNT